MNITCIDSYRMQPWECNARLQIITNWLSENAGNRWGDWDWVQYGIIVIYYDTELATMFKLKFGL